MKGPVRLPRSDGRGMLFDIASYARPGSLRRDRLSPGETEQITLTVRRAPEVMVKVLTRGGQDLKAIGRHLSYLNRGGDLDIETDDGERIKGEGVESELLSDWDLELEEVRRRSKLGPPGRPGTTQNGAQAFVLDAAGYVFPEGSGSGQKLCAGGICASASLRDGAAYGRTASACAHASQSNERAGAAAKHPKSDPAPMAI